jgi:hypothetical protein
MKIRNKIFLLSLLILAALIFGLYQWLFHFGLMEQIINNRLENYLNEKLTMRAEIGDISGDGWNYLNFSDVDIIYDDGETSYSMAHIPILRVHYTWRHLWDGKYLFEKIEFDSAAFTLRQTPEKIWLLPKSKKKKSSDSPNAPFDFQVSELSLNNISLNLIMSEDSMKFDNIFFDARIEGRDRTFSAIIDRFSYQASDARLNLVSAGGVVTATGDNIMFQDFLIRTDSSDLKIKGQTILGDNLRTFIGLDAKRINLGELSSFLKTNLSGNMSAVGILEYQAGRLAGDVTLSGTFQNRLFDSIKTKFSYGEKKFQFDTLMGTMFDGCRINARGDIDLSQKPPTYNLIGEIRKFDLNNLIFNSYKTDFNGMINLSGAGFNKRELAINVITSLDESWFDEYHAWMAAGEMIITADSIRFFDDFAVKYHDNFFLVGGLLDYGGTISITGRTDFNDLSAFNEKSFIKRMGGRDKIPFRPLPE